MTRKNPPLTYRRLFDLLSYSRSTGVFTWRIRRGRTAKVGDEAGTIDRNGHIMIGIDGHMYAASRLAWFYATKEWPGGKLGFVDGDPSNLRFQNLRDGPARLSTNPVAAYQRELRDLNAQASKIIAGDRDLLERYNYDRRESRRVMCEVRDSIRINGYWRK